MAQCSLGLGACLEGIDAVPIYSYTVLDVGETVHILYPSHAEGRSFHHGRFVQNLLTHARVAQGIDLLEVTVTDLTECPLTHCMLGVQARRNNVEAKETFFANLVIIADSSFFNFRSTVMGGGALSKRAVVCSNFVGAVLENVMLPILA